MAKNTIVRRFCSNCEKETELQLLTKEEIVKVRDEPIKVKVQYWKCTECGDEVLDPSLNEDPFYLAYKEYRRRHGLLKPEEMRDWRKAHNLTQGELAKLIGVGTATISRYENGSLQDQSHEKLLRLIMEPSNFLTLIEHSEGIFTESKKERLARALREAEAESYSFDTAIIVNLGNYEADEFSGYKRLDLAKLYNAIIFFCKDGLFKTKLNKLLFYADFKHFKEYTLSITGARYAHVPFGPAPDNYEFYYASLNSRKAIEFEEVLYPSGAGGEIIKATQTPDLSLFTPGELRIMASVMEDFADHNASDVSEISHKEAAYRETEDGELISYNYALKLNY